MLFQGLRILAQFAKENLYFGDYKPENFLITFSGRNVKIGDFGCSLFMQTSNYLKGLSLKYALPEVREMMLKNQPVSPELLAKNDIHAFFKTYGELLE